MEDYLIRATAGDAQIRAFAVTARAAVEEARRVHDTSPVVTAALGRLLSGGLMMGAMLKGERDLVTLQLQCEGPIRGMTVTADSVGTVKGYAIEPQIMLPASAAGKLDVGGAVGSGVLRVVRDMGLKEPYVGQTALQTGEIAEDLTYYFAVSEQTPSTVGLGVLMERNNTVRQAGGFIIQLLPSAEERVIGALESNLAGVASVTSILDAGHPPEEMLGLLLDGLQPVVTDRRPVRFACNCGREKVEKTLIGLGKEELKDMIADSRADGRDTEVTCHFCNSSYKFGAEELTQLLKRASE